MVRASILALTVILLIAGCSSDAPPVTGAAVAQQGILIIAFAAHESLPQDLASLTLNISGISLKTSDGEWLPLVIENPRTDLTELARTAKRTALTQAALPQGEYSHLRIEIDSAQTRTSRGQSLAIMPGNTLTFSLPLRIDEGKSSVLTLTHDLSQSFRTSKEGRAIFAPVITFELAHTTDAAIDTARALSMTRGENAAQGIAGMDITGSFGPGRSIPAGDVLTVIDGNVQLVGPLSSSRLGSSIPLNVSVSVTIRDDAINPGRIEAFQEQRLTLILRTLDNERGIAIPDLGLNQSVRPGESISVRVRSPSRGIFDITCSAGCGDHPGRVLGKLIIR